MTRLIRGLVLAIFTLGLVFSVGSTWTTKHLYEVDGFVDATAAIGKNEQVRSTMINVTAVQLTAKLPVGPNISAQVSSAVTEVLTKLVDQPEFDMAWRESMHRTHEHQFFGAETPRVLTLNLAPFVDMAIAESRTLTFLGVTAPEEVLVEVPSIRVDLAVKAVSAAAEYRFFGYLVTILAGVIYFATSRPRRRAKSVFFLGAISVVVSVLLAVFMRVASEQAADRMLAGAREYSGFIRPARDMAVESFDLALVPFAAIGLVLSVAGLIWRAVSAHQR